MQNNYINYLDFWLLFSKFGPLCMCLNLLLIEKSFVQFGTYLCNNIFLLLQIKNEESYLNDRRLTNDKLHNGVNYIENREFRSKDVYLYYHFITRLYLDHFIKLINDVTEENCPDIIFLNSCLWDLARWGGDGARNYRQNLLRTMMLLKSKLPPKVRVIWKTALPVSVQANGALFTSDIKHIVPVLPWFIQQANLFASKCASFFNFDTLDLHFYMRLQGHLRVKDGIHWHPIAVRYMTNIFLTHVCLCLGQTLPGNFMPSQKFLIETSKQLNKPEIIQKRVEKKAGFFKNLFAIKANIIKKTDKFQSVIKNVIVKASKKVSKARNLKKNIKKVAKQYFKKRGQYDLNEARNACDYPLTSANTQQYVSNFVNQFNDQQNYNRNNYNYPSYYQNQSHYKYTRNNYYDDYYEGRQVYNQYKY